MKLDGIKLKRATLLALVAAGTILGGASAHAQHGHLNAGAVSQDAGAQLAWIGGEIFATNSGYIQTMNYSSAGTYAGFYNSGPTMTSLPNSLANNGPSPFAALGGSFVNVQLTLISAPEGATFAFWESGSLTPAYVLGEGGFTPLIELSDFSLGAGSPGGDPYGHIHGRRFSGTAVGDYIVALQLFDTSDLGPGATPIHTPSDILYMQFSAVAPVPEPTSAVMLGIGSLALFFVRASRKRSLPGNS